MKRHAWKVLTMIGLLAAFAATAPAEDLYPAVKANVPFSFMAGGETFPAGEYMITGHHAPGILLVRGADNRAIAAVRVNWTYAKTRQPKTSLVFNRYGNDYFLTQVWTAFRSLGFQLPKSQRERELVAKGITEELVVAAVSQK